jgi:hypothetical protein
VVRGLRPFFSLATAEPGPRVVNNSGTGKRHSGAGKQVLWVVQEIAGCNCTYAEVNYWSSGSREGVVFASDDGVVLGEKKVRVEKGM